MPRRTHPEPDNTDAKRERRARDIGPDAAWRLRRAEQEVRAERADEKRLRQEKRDGQ